MTTTRDDLRGAHYRFCRAAQFLLAEGETFTLDIGSKTYGRAWRLFVMKPGTSGHYNPPAGISDYLGWTKAEATSTLHALTSGLEAAREHFEKVTR